MKEELKETLDHLYQSMRRKSDEKHAPWVRKMIEEHAHLDIRNPETFSLMKSLTADAQVDLLARTALSHRRVASDKKAQIEFVYKQYKFITNHLKSVILKYEGHGCSTDKTRWLIQTYVNYLLTDNLPTVEEKSFWHPKAGEILDWMMWIKSMQSLYYGNEEDYITLKMKITQACQDHLSHRFSSLHEGYEKHEHFFHFEWAEGKKQYTFLHPETKDTGTILLDDACCLSYRFFFEHEQRLFTYEDTMPSWFDELLKTNP